MRWNLTKPAAIGLAIALMCAESRADDTPQTKMDVRCVVAALKLGASSNGEEKYRAGLLMLYYIGRLDGRSPGLPLERLLEREKNSMSSDDLAAETRRCGESFASKGKEIQRIGDDLAAKGE